MFKKIKRYLADPYWALGCDLIKKHPSWMSDEFYIRTLWRMVMGYKLDLKNPKTFNEKLQWLKLYDHNPLYTTLVDKLRVKDWVAEKIGAQYVIPTLAVWESAEDIDISKLPDQFVLKCNHDSGSVVICKDKAKFDLVATKEKLGKALQHNFYWDAREWAYKHVKPCIFAEAYMEDSNSDDLLTYKFLCFDGEPKLMYVTVKNDNIWENYYDMDFRLLDLTRKYPNHTSPLAKPKCFDEMKEVAAKLSKGMSHVRIDLYEVNGQIYFSEYTFYDWGGLFDFKDNRVNNQLGEYVRLQK